jgi:DNA-binding NarL/FixJ family response regulator
MNLFPPECTVALIDDRPESKDLIGYAIKSSFPSIRVREHASAREFIDGLATERPAAVITRQRLYGDMDGLSLTRVLRSSGFSGPILMITNAEELRAEAEQAGISAFMSFDRWAELPSRLASLLTAGAT